MQVLFIGCTDATSGSSHYYTNLLRLGHTVLAYDPRYFAASSPWEALGIRLRKGPGRAKVRRVHEDLLRLCRRNHFDLVFVMAENFLGADTIHEMREALGRSARFIYHSHDNNFSEGICKPSDFLPRTLAAYDAVFTTKSQNVTRYRECGQPNAHFVPSAYEPGIHAPVPVARSRYRNLDLHATFVGTYDLSRDPLLGEQNWETLHVWGSHWERSPLYPLHRERIQPRPIYYFEFADVLSSSKLSLGLLRAEALDLHTQRTFEIPACGTMQISPRTDEILGFFEENEEIVCFDSPEELRDKIGYYLKKDRQRDAIASRGHARCVAGRHTYRDRVIGMLGITFPEAGARLFPARAMHPATSSAPEKRVSGEF